MKVVHKPDGSTTIYPFLNRFACSPGWESADHIYVDALGVVHFSIAYEPFTRDNWHYLANAAFKAFQISDEKIRGRALTGVHATMTAYLETANDTNLTGD